VQGRPRRAGEAAACRASVGEKLAAACRGGGEELWPGRAGGVQGRPRRAGPPWERRSWRRRAGAACRGGVGERRSYGSVCG